MNNLILILIQVSHLEILAYFCGYGPVGFAGFL
uniref:Uncharacterized protein n=1 Tax=Rhizophora mucronata TaxID=61149 RepID=A0A2P2JFL6_RHIMU